MYCKNCGNEVNDKAVACPKCGVNSHSENKYCPDCGVETNPNQIMCIKCGVSLAGKTNNNNESDKTVAILAYCTLLGFIIAAVMYGNNKTKLGAYHLRQSLGVMITGVAIYIASIILMFIPFLLFIMAFIMPFIGIFIMIFLIIGLINAINGQMKPIPMLGHLYEKWLATMFV